MERLVRWVALALVLFFPFVVSVRPGVHSFFISLLV
jgi:hypothetical protein